MQISLGAKFELENMNVTNGYGYATDRMIDSLQRLGHTIRTNDATAPVEIWFDQPHHWKWRKSQYKIGYHPWESTRLQKGWVDLMNQTDEIWTPSPLIAKWYAEDGVEKPIYVYEHGVDRVWSPQKREVKDKIMFLHVGAEAARKGGWDVMTLFRRAFPTRKDVGLTLKIVNRKWTDIEKVGRINIINRKMSLTELVSMFHSHHVYAYPSWGEGFGLTPLQAMATGMPTITVPDWAPYKRFLDPRLTLSAKLKPSPWQQIHPGKMLRPSFDDLVDRMRWVADNYDDAHQFALSQTGAVQDEYDWDSLTREAFDNLEKRL